MFHIHSSRAPRTSAAAKRSARRLIKLSLTRSFTIYSAFKSNRATLRGATASLCFVMSCAPDTAGDVMIEPPRLDCGGVSVAVVTPQSNSYFRRCHLSVCVATDRDLVPFQPRHLSNNTGERRRMRPFRYARVKNIAPVKKMVKSHVACSTDLVWALVQKKSVYTRRSCSSTRQNTSTRSFSAEKNNLYAKHSFKFSGTCRPQTAAAAPTGSVWRVCSASRCRRSSARGGCTHGYTRGAGFPSAGFVHEKKPKNKP
jgi:hypothetical protein